MSEHVGRALTKPWLKTSKTTRFESGRRDKPRLTELRKQTGRKMKMDSSAGFKALQDGPQGMRGRWDPQSSCLPRERPQGLHALV